MNRYCKFILACSILLAGNITEPKQKNVISHISAVKITKKVNKNVLAANEAHLSQLNPLVFEPTEHGQGKLSSIPLVCKRIEKGCYFKNDNIHVTINNKTYNLSYKIPSGKKGRICIFVSGYSGKMSGSMYRYKGSGAYAVYRHLKHNVMRENVWISFDGPVSYRKTFNFGQELDQSCLHEIYTEVVRRNPEAEIIFVGLCKGATTILNYLTNTAYTDTFDPVKAIILESPLVSFETCTKKIARSKLPWPFGSFLPGFFRVAFPNYKWDQPTILQAAPNFPTHIKVFIGCSHHDSVAPCKDAHKIKTCLKNKQIDVDFFEEHDKDIKHALLTSCPQYQNRVESFIQQA